jgi:hypothetical protein
MKSVLAMAAAVAMAVAAGTTVASAAITLDGVKDASYGPAVATDPVGDLASPGPADWTGVAWTDLRDLSVTNDGTNLYVHTSMPNYSTSDSHGSFGLAIDVKNTAGGGTTDPWGNAITFAQANLPDFVVRGNTPADGSWAELRSWNGTDFGTGGGTNWGGAAGNAEVGSNVAWNAGNGLELAIPLASLGVGPGDTVNLLLYAGQTDGRKGAYDTVPSDNQSTGWDAPTTQTAYASYTVAAVPEPASIGLLGGAGLLALARRRK